MIKIGVVGACGKMGSEVVKLAINNPEFELTCAIDKFNVGKKITEQVSIEEDITKAIEKNKPDVVVDFTQPSIIFENIKTYQNSRKCKILWKILFVWNIN